MRKIVNFTIIVSCFFPVASSLFLGFVLLLPTEPNPIFERIHFITKIWSSATVISVIVIFFLWIVMILNCIYNLKTTEKKSIYIKWLILLIVFNFAMAPIYYFKKFKWNVIAK